MISLEQKQKAIRLYRNKSLTLREIANLCDISSPSFEIIVRQAVDEGILKPRDAFRKSLSSKSRFTDAELEQIAVDYYEKGMSVAQLKEKWQLYPKQIQRVRNRFGDKYGKKVMGGEFRVRPVQQFDKQGALIAEFPNGHQASLETGIGYVAINRCCNGLSKSAGGFVWSFKNGSKMGETI